MLRTGQEAYDFGDPEYFQYPGMTRDGTLFLAETGAKILCTDALGWDRPFPVIRRTFRETGDRSTIWDGHFAGRETEVFIVQQISQPGRPTRRAGSRSASSPCPLPAAALLRRGSSLSSPDATGDERRLAVIRRLPYALAYIGLHRDRFVDVDRDRGPGSPSPARSPNRGCWPTRSRRGMANLRIRFLHSLDSRTHSLFVFVVQRFSTSTDMART